MKDSLLSVSTFLVRLLTTTSFNSKDFLPAVSSLDYDKTTVMQSSLMLAALTALFAATASAGTYYIDNYCPFPMYLQSTSIPQVGSPPLVTLSANTTNAYNEIMRTAAYSINALTLSRTPDLASPMQATYHQTDAGPNPGWNFYALSTIYGDPLVIQGFQLLTEPDGFGLNCPPRSPGLSCPYTYSPDNLNGMDPEAVYEQNDLEDLRLLLCMYNVNGTASKS